ncbi:cerebellin-2-like isoform X2 [Labeo rohita]|uniref:cerebellin-2-like isoform X2 n=1 Tax=Labeo rohita TaxID=84645 RepID=UPI0021E1D74A|nr:cerebellin-2-like isoform X2 [Labeo rohita]
MLLSFCEATGKTLNLYYSQREAMMKLEISIVLLLCTWTTLGEEFKRAKIAFSATLSASWDSVYFGPHEEATTLVYENVFTNIGNAYDKNTGIFTAPVKGVYFFNYVVFNAGEKPTGVKLLKNGNLVLAALDNAPGQDTEDTTSNSVSLILEQGDQIKLQLLESRRIYTDAWRRNTFSGHLLFTL